MKKVSGFTILEMLINMTIMSIIISLIYFTYSALVQQIQKYQQALNEEMHFNIFYTQLKQDFYDAEYVEKSNEGFKCISYTEEIVEYKVDSKIIIRTQKENRDTLIIRNARITSDLNKIVNKELVKKLDTETSLFDEPLNFSLYKNYAPNLKFAF